MRNPEWGTAARRHDLNMFMTRIIFCLFADGTGIFEEGLFKRTIHDMSGHDGEEMERVLGILFTAMNMKEGKRDDLPAWARRFPYVNGGLFAGSVDAPAFSREAYRHLIEAARLDWRHISPDIFGSMIQVIVDPGHRHETGMHYTSVPNILKALDPLFLDDLRAEADRKPLADRSKEQRRLQALLGRLSKIRVFDPACGSGNFLIIAYRELRSVEMRVLARLRDLTGETPGLWSHVELDNFYGIEVNDFAAETAKLSLWVARYQQDKIYEATFGKAPPALPMKDEGTIVTGNALRLNWLEVCPPPVRQVPRQKILDLATVVQVHGKNIVPDEEVETYIVGNPPYLGFNYQSPTQKKEVEDSFRGRTRTWKSLDYVACWFVRCADYCAALPNSEGALVATNSICQGQQVQMLWPVILNADIEIAFAGPTMRRTPQAAPA